MALKSTTCLWDVVVSYNRDTLNSPDLLRRLEKIIPLCIYLSLWKLGEPFRGDPAVEEQGLNSILGSDQSTWSLIRKYSKP